MRIWWLHWILIKSLAQTLPSSSDSSHFGKHQMALKCDNGFYQFLHTGRDIPQQEYLSQPSGTVWASRQTIPCSPEQGLVVDGAYVDGTMSGRRACRNGYFSALRLWGGGGEDSGTFLSQAAGTAVTHSSCRAQNGSERGLSLLRPGRRPPVSCWLWVVGAGLSLRFE